MKKLLAFMLAAALALSLAACGGGNRSMTEEEMLKAAEEKTFSDFTAGNKAYAESCIGDIYKMTGYVLRIDSDYATLSRRVESYFGDGGANVLSPIYLHVYLPSDELADLVINQEVVVVGEVTGVSEEEINYVMNNVVICLDMENAYLVEDITYSDTSE